MASRLHQAICEASISSRAEVSEEVKAEVGATKMEQVGKTDDLG